MMIDGENKVGEGAVTRGGENSKLLIHKGSTNLGGYQPNPPPLVFIFQAISPIQSSRGTDLGQTLQERTWKLCEMRKSCYVRWIPRDQDWMREKKW